MNTKNVIKSIAPKWAVSIYSFFRVTRFKVLRWVPRYDEDELMTSHKCDFVHEERFRRCYKMAVQAKLAVSEKIRWRAHVACWAAQHAASLGGDFVECGVNKGFLSKIVMDYIGFQGRVKKTFYLLDTFEGFVDEYLVNEEREKHKFQGSIYEPCYEIVKETFGHMKNVKIIKGAVPDTLGQVTSKRISYLSIDMNCVQPEIAAAEYFWGKMTSGGVLLLDDYGHAGHELQKEAFDEFAQKHEVPILSLPTGQGLILKP